MEPNKIDKQYREKLNARQIQPSAQAWDRLDAMLSVAEEKKTKRPFGFLFIAAGILVLVTLGLFFFTQIGTANKANNSVVTKEVINTAVENDTNQIKEPISVMSKQNDEVAAVDHQTKTHSSVTRSPQSIINQKAIVNQQNKENPNQINKDKAIVYEFSGDVALKDLPKITTTNQKVVSSPQYVNVDELLQSVEKSKTNMVRPSIKVNAASLLSQVDGEVEHTFREKVFTKINKNYQQIKVALANRNQE